MKTVFGFFAAVLCCGVGCAERAYLGRAVLLHVCRLEVRVCCDEEAGGLCEELMRELRGCGGRELVMCASACACELC